MTTPFTGLTPGDVYAMPTPQPIVPVTFQGVFGINGNTGILEPPFNQNTLPLIVPGPQVVSTQVTGATGQAPANNLLVNDTTGKFSVTFDRPVQVSTFTPSDVLQIMGPTGPVTGPQVFPSDVQTGQNIPAPAIRR